MRDWGMPVGSGLGPVQHNPGGLAQKHLRVSRYRQLDSGNPRLEIGVDVTREQNNNNEGGFVGGLSGSVVTEFRQ